MKFGIVYTNNNDSIGKIVKMVNSHNEFRNYVIQAHTDAKYIDIGTQRDVRKLDIFTTGRYLQEEVGGNVITLLDKHEDVISGYVYNTKKMKVDHIGTYTLIPCDFDYVDPTIKLSHFELNSLVQHPHIALIAKRGTGKTNCVKNIVDQQIAAGYVKEEDLIIICPVEPMCPAYSTKYPLAQIYYKYDTAIIDEVLREQRDPKTKTGSKFIVFDDCFTDKGSWSKDALFAELMLNARHYSIGTIMVMQFPLGLKPEYRANFDYVFLLAEDFTSNQKRLYDHYANMFPTFETFKRVFKAATENFGCMVVTNKGKSISDKVFWHQPVLNTTSSSVQYKQEFGKYD